MSSNYLPAGFESFRPDYFESDEDDELNDIVYPEASKQVRPVIQVSPAEERLEDESERNEDFRSDRSTDDEESGMNGDARSQREYSVNRYDPEETSDQVNKDGCEQDDNFNDIKINWFREEGKEEEQPGSSCSLSPDDSRSRETRSPSPGVLLLEDIRIATINGDLNYIQQQMNIDHGFFIDTVLKNGWTALMYACDFGYHEIVLFCLENHADPNYHFDNFTPLMAACASFYAEEDKVLIIVELLIRYGAMIDARDLSNKTALMYACETGKSEVALFLAKKGANVTLKDSKHWTVLHFAAKRGFGPVVRHMIDHGASLDAYNNYGHSPSDVAMEAGFHELGVLMERLRNKQQLTIDEHGILMQRVTKEATFKTYKTNYLTDLEYFLGEIGLEDYVQFFEEQKLSYSDLMCFNETDIDALDIKQYGIKLKIWEGIKKCHKKNWQPSRISFLKQKSQLSCPESVTILKNISNHLRYMETTIKYLQNHLKNDPEMILRGNQIANINDILNQSKDTFAQGETFITSLESFINDVTCKTVTTNGHKIPTAKRKPIQKETKEKQPIPYKTPMIISGLFGLGAIIYFQKDSISSFFSTK